MVGVDNLSPYFFPSLKAERERRLRKLNGFISVRADITDLAALTRVFDEYQPEYVVNLAAQAGVRFSIKNPQLYEKTNIAGFLNVLESCRRFRVSRLVYASSSSVYGGLHHLPFRETDRVDSPISLYAATKLANEAMAHCYSHLFGFTALGLRYFTVYGPFGRPEMAMWLFAEKILAGEPIPVFNEGRMRRDFTYIDDIVAGTIALLFAEQVTGHAVFNIGAGHCEDLEEMIGLLEDSLGRRATRQPLPMQPGDVPASWADVSRLQDATGYCPVVTIREGVPRFARWYLDHPDIAASVRQERLASEEQP